MILLKANPELKIIFQKLINTMGVQLNWSEVFIVKDNNLLLPGKDGVLLFDFGNRVISANSAKVNMKEDNIEQIIKNELLQNVLNMTLYVFGKWGKIKGLTVEKDYQQLNRLFGYFLNKINVDPVLTEDNLNFYKESAPVSYEEIIQAIIEQQKEKDKEEKDKEDKDKEDKDKEDKDKEENEATQESTKDEVKLDKRKYDIGLWRKIVWTSGQFTFVKEEISESDKVTSRIGNNFYMVAYKCPICGEKLYLVIYPAGKELLIETDEKGVYLARAYTCYHCHRLFTPKPQRLLLEGNVYDLDFEDDRQAFEDYLEVIGKLGARTSNCNFNEYELDYNNKKHKDEPQLEDICNHMDSMSEQDIDQLQDKMDSGFYPQKSTEKYYKKVVTELKSRRDQSQRGTIKKDRLAEETRLAEEDRLAKEDSKKDSKKVSKKDNEKNNKKSKNSSSDLSQHHTNGSSVKSKRKDRIQRDSVKRFDYRINSKGSVKFEYRTKSDENMNLKNNNTNNSSNTSYTVDSRENSQQKASRFESATGNPYGNTAVTSKQPDNPYNQNFSLNERKNSQEPIISIDKEKVLLKKAEDCKEKNYVNIIRTMEEIKKEDCSDGMKETLLQTLEELLRKQGKKELDAIRLKIPNQISKAQYKQFKEMIEQYKEIDHSTYLKHLDSLRDDSEKQEIAAYIKRANAKDRNTLQVLHGKLKKEDFEKRNVDPFLENIQDKIYAMDEALVKRICPDPASLSFDEGLKAYEEISSKDILQDLKANILGAIDRRLTRIKMNECEQLVNKLSKEMGKMLRDHSRLHLYPVRQELQSQAEEEDTQIIHKALDKYASERGRYEFPILICDASSKENGGRGFVLTPDHIFYNCMLNSGVIDILKINSIITQKNMNHTSLYADTSYAGKVKISNSLKLDNLKLFVNVLNNFINYLKEKPESRDISYMVKEKHNVKCCYRCGFVYKGDNICPKCGAKFNE